MRASASAEDVAHIVGLIEEAGGGAHVTEDGDATVIGAIGERAQIAVLPLEGLPGVDQVLPLRKPYKWVSREFSKTDTVIDVLRPQDRRRRVHGDGRAVLGRELRADAAGGARMCRRRRVGAPRRGLQAALVAVRLPGPRPRRARHPRAGARGHGAARRDRADGRARPRGRVRPRRPDLDRRAQHAELQPALRDRQDRQARDAQARAWRRRSRSS